MLPGSLSEVLLETLGVAAELMMRYNHFMNSIEARTTPTAALYQAWRDAHLDLFSDGDSISPGTREDFEVEDAIAFQAFKWGYAGNHYLLDPHFGPDGGIWDVISAAHSAGCAAYDGSRNEWGWNPED